MLLSFLAALQGGTALQTEVTEQLSELRQRDAGATARLGIPTIASLLGLTADASGSLRRQTSSGEQRETKVLRQHTESSLFNVLRQLMSEDKTVKRLTGTAAELGTLAAGQLVEFEATFQPEPLARFLDFFLAMAPLGLAANASTSSPPPNSGSNSRSRASRPPAKAPVATPEEQLVELLGPNGQIMLSVRDDILRSSVADLRADLSPELRAVVSFTREFLPPQGEAILYHGTFRVMGKVFAMETGDSGVNLLRRTSVGLFPAALQEVITAIRAMVEDGGMDMPLVSTSVEGPLLQVLPLAIFT